MRNTLKFYSQLAPQQKHSVDLAKECGASSWLSVLPLSEQGFHLNKEGVPGCLVSASPTHLDFATVVKFFTTDHAMVCRMGGCSTFHHNEIKDLMATLLTDVCFNVAMESHLQPLMGETFQLASTNTDDGVQLDVQARGFWRSHQDAFFDIRVFNANAPSSCSRSLGAAYKKHDMPYSSMIGWLRCKLSFSLLRSAVLCIREQIFSA